MPDLDDLRHRITEALYESMGRCTCGSPEVCGTQIDAVMTVLQEAGVLAEGTVTEWAIRVSDPDSGRTDESLTVASEEVARAAVPAWRRGGWAEVAVVSRQVTPWTEAPEPDTQRTCRHCGAEIVPCNPVHEIVVCKGWKHTQFIDSMPVGAHYCDGRSVNPSAEPAPETAKEE